MQVLLVAVPNMTCYPSMYFLLKKKAASNKNQPRFAEEYTVQEYLITK